MHYNEPLPKMLKPDCIFDQKLKLIGFTGPNGDEAD